MNSYCRRLWFAILTGIIPNQSRLQYEFIAVSQRHVNRATSAQAQPLTESNLAILPMSLRCRLSW